jgi:glycosyltransferase involved in cell wall biosynthesis
MDVGLVAYNVKPTSGWGVRVRSVMQMLSSFSDVTLVHTEADPGTLPGSSGGHRNRAIHVDHPEDFSAKLTRLVNYYRNDRAKVEMSGASAVGGIGALQIESLDLFSLGRGLNRNRAPIILDEHNVWWILNRYSLYDSPFFKSGAGRRGPMKRIVGPWMMWRAEAFEAKAIRRSDHVLVTSSLDAERISAKVEEARGKTTVIPNCINAEEYPCRFGRSEGEGPRQVVFVGRLDYFPNADAARTIREEIAPRFGEDVQFTIVGGPVPDGVGSAANVRFTGQVPDIREWLAKADVCIAPLRHGSGTRIKILEYLAMGKPVVSTPIGCEGLGVTHGEDILVAESPEQQARAIASILANDSLARSLGRNGRRLIETKYDWRGYVSALREVYERLARS